MQVKMGINKTLRNVSFGLLGTGALAGALYLAYKMGRIDEIDELCSIIDDQGEMVFTFQTKDHKGTKILM
jgi:hypothetical protein